jgi:glycosyltransferase involved in cell wall biosynthesis
VRIAMVTPVRNGADLIEETIESVLGQRALAQGRVELDYIVRDGNSTDDTVERARRALGKHGQVISEPDTGMYDALARGLRDINGDVYGYLNAGDLLQPGCFDVLADCFGNQHVDWLCGLHLYYAESGDIVGARLPFRYTTRMLRRGYYGRGLPTIQQESTFWSADLMSRVDLDELARYRLAGDFFLWHTFAAHARPHVVARALGGFRYHGDHLSDAREEYRRELAEIAGPLRPRDYPIVLAEKILWHTPQRLRARWAGPTVHLNALGGRT